MLTSLKVVRASTRALVEIGRHFSNNVFKKNRMRIVHLVNVADFWILYYTKNSAGVGRWALTSIGTDTEHQFIVDKL
jgi:hypothetical protein